MSIYRHNHVDFPTWKCNETWCYCRTLKNSLSFLIEVSARRTLFLSTWADLWIYGWWLGYDFCSFVNMDITVSFEKFGVAHLKLFRITAKILSKYDIYNCIFQSEKFPGGSKPNVGESLIIHSYLWQRQTYASCIAPPIGLIPIALMPIACLLTLQLCSKMNI